MTRRICALDTSGPIGTFALAEDGRLRIEREQRVSNAHGESILPLIDEACRELAWTPKSIERWIVGVGPGSFTGARIATSLVKGIAMATQAEVVAVTSFEVLVASYSSAIAFVDAMKGDRYVQTWRAGKAEEPAYVPAVSLQEWVRLERGRVGSEVTLIGDVPEGIDDATIMRRPPVRASEMLFLGLQKTPVTALEPLYVRSADIHVAPRAN